MKKVLVDYKGCIQNICDPGQEHEIYEGPDAAIRWVNVDDDTVNYSWILVDGAWQKNVMAPPNYAVIRKGHYGEIGDQLDMIYNDMKNGTKNWIDHIDAVKAVVPGPDSDEAKELSAARPPINWSTPENPAWTDPNNNHIPGLVHTVGVKDSVVLDPAALPPIHDPAAILAGTATPVDPASLSNVATGAVSGGDVGSSAEGGGSPHPGTLP